MTKLGLLVLLGIIVVCHASKRLSVRRLTVEKYRCKGVGMQPFPRNCRAALLCGVNDDGEFIPQAAVTCPSGQAFNAANNTCDFTKNVPSCPTNRIIHSRAAKVQLKISKAARALCSGRGTFCVSCDTVGMCLAGGVDPAVTFNCSSPKGNAVYCNKKSSQVAYCGAYIAGESCPGF